MWHHVVKQQCDYSTVTSWDEVRSKGVGGWERTRVWHLCDKSELPACVEATPPGPLEYNAAKVKRYHRLKRRLCTAAQDADTSDRENPITKPDGKKRRRWPCQQYRHDTDTVIVYWSERKQRILRFRQIVCNFAVAPLVLWLAIKPYDGWYIIIWYTYNLSHCVVLDIKRWQHLNGVSLGL